MNTRFRNRGEINRKGWTDCYLETRVNIYYSNEFSESELHVLWLNEVVGEKNYVFWFQRIDEWSVKSHNGRIIYDSIEYYLSFRYNTDAIAYKLTF
jgi:hypothetical protein